MTGKTHAAVGCAIGLVAEYMDPVSAPRLAGTVLGVQVERLIGIVIGGLALVAWSMFVARLPDVDLRLGLPHRGPTHSLVVMAAVTLIVALAAAAWMPSAAIELAAVTGAANLSHLLADLMNPSRMALLWPWPGRQRPSWLPAVIENSWPGRLTEAMVILAIVGVVGWCWVEVAIH